MNKSDNADKLFLRSILNAMPHAVFVVDNDIKIMACNDMAQHQLSDEEIFDRRGGEVLRCLNAIESQEGCGRSDACKTCNLRNNVNQVFGNGKMHRSRVQIHSLDKNGLTVTNNLLLTIAPFEFYGKSFILLTVEDINDLIELRNYVPICSKCKNIRNEDNYWIRLEKYFKDHLNLDFSHGLCPECREIMLEEIHNHP